VDMLAMMACNIVSRYRLPVFGFLVAQSVKT